MALHGLFGSGMRAYGRRRSRTLDRKSRTPIDVSLGMWPGRGTILITIEALRGRSDAIGVIGLGYVGVSLVVALVRHFRVYGYDIDCRRVRELQAGFDRTGSVTAGELEAARGSFSSSESVIGHCRFVIVAVPTPIMPTRAPDLGPLKRAAQVTGRHLAEGALVVVESTVYPGVTEDVVRPILARESKLHPGKEFHVGYSPERINPGDSEHSLGRISKVIAGESAAVTELMAWVYGTISNGVHCASSIKIAEAAKVLENTQRDLNIALINEAAMLFDHLGVDTREVIRTASTKWNFATFEPGLVGGDCIATDPYYLIHVAKELGRSAAVISAGREVNDGIGKYVAERTVALIGSKSAARGRVRILVLGVSFKEDIPRVQNSRVADIIDTLTENAVTCSVFDPVADPDEVRECYGYELLDDVARDAPYHAVIVAVKHRFFTTRFPISEVRKLMVQRGAVLVDVKSMYEREEIPEDVIYWSL